MTALREALEAVGVTAPTDILTRKFDRQAEALVNILSRNVTLACGQNPEYEAIMFEALERRIMTLRHQATRRAARI